MSSRVVVAVWTLAWLVFGGSLCRASTLTYDGGSPNGSQFAVSEWYLIMDDFSFARTSTVRGLTLHDPMDSWVIADGTDDAPVQVLASGDFERDAATAFSGSYYMPMPALRLEGGRTYWLGLLYGSFENDDVCHTISSWGASNGNGSARPTVVSFPRRGDCGSTWHAEIVGTDLQAYAGRDGDVPPHIENMAFQVHATPVAEPSLLALTLLAMTAYCRRRQSA